MFEVLAQPIDFSINAFIASALGSGFNKLNVCTSIINFVDSLMNLDSLLIQIKQEATQVWYPLGEAFGIEKKILDKFNTCSPEQSIIEMLDYWLRNHPGQPTWKEVAEALRNIHLNMLASRIENLVIYKAGKTYFTDVWALHL